MVNLKEFYALQASLDAEIAQKHNVTYESTHSRRLLALIVELGELANETRCFKYWSNKPASDKPIVMDEFADGLHFLLSLGVPLKANKFEYKIEKSEDDLTTQFHRVYILATSLLDHYDLTHYEACFQAFLNLTPSLGMSEQDIIDAYKAKLSINYKRQENNY